MPTYRIIETRSYEEAYIVKAEDADEAVAIWEQGGGEMDYESDSYGEDYRIEEIDG